MQSYAFSAEYQRNTSRSFTRKIQQSRILRHSPEETLRSSSRRKTSNGGKMTLRSFRIEPSDFHTEKSIGSPELSIMRAVDTYIKRAIGYE